ncbi:MAG: UDP-N-acetylmuramoyl-tripeptide--D-alanyl-D-alanine ligase [Eubacteriales bacterium]|nr:UDP-N-acetylmuramoyl-tripeptide--D-alanyl-D-alanine ligase [Eubacteriales bacterium]
MKTFLFQEILSACGGEYVGDPALLFKAATGIVIDSRNAVPGSLYVPIIGENHDGHAFIPAARANGASLVLSDRELQDPPYILVANTLFALQAIAARYRSLFSIPVVGLTGSAGKTSTKDMVAAALGAHFSVLKTQGNLNNETGAPLTLFSLEESHEVAVVEMGTNHFGEIDRIAAMVRPDICLFTNIGYAHIENFGTREGIFRGKTEMLKYMRPGGHIVANGDDDFLVQLPDAMLYGLGAHCNVLGTEIEDLLLDGMNFSVTYFNQQKRMHVPALGLHSVYNALAAVSVGLLLGMRLDEIASGIETYLPLPGRMNVVKLSRYTVIDDTYNANPTSVQASVDVLAKCSGRRVCILGDMRELGRESARLHEEIGVYTANSGADLLLFVGTESIRMCEGASKSARNRAHYFETQEALIAELPNWIQPGDTILVKASRGMHLENTVKALLALS